MLTIFCSPRPWQDEFAVIQQNAIRSWLRTSDEVLLLGDERGTEGAAAELHVRHIPEVERNAMGVPLVRSVFEQGERHASYELLAYANADILLFPCFRQALLTIASIFAHGRS